MRPKRSGRRVVLSPRPLPNLRSQPLRKTRRPGAAGVRDDGLLELGQVPEDFEPALDGRDELLGLDAIGGQVSRLGHSGPPQFG